MKELIKKQHEEYRKAYESLEDKTSAAALQLLGAMGAYENLCPELKENEDVKMLNKLHSWMNEFGGAEEYTEKVYQWVKGLIEKQGEKKPIYQKFRVGDKVKYGYLTYTIDGIDEDSYKLQAYSKDGHKGCTKYLTIGCEKGYELIEQKSAWSEEDESHIRYLIECLEHCKNGVALTMTTSTSQEYINWLKSLKPQNTWKPTAAQMFALKQEVENKFYNGGDIDLNSLYNDLIKLL